MKKKILIIDDDTELCAEFAEILQDEGHSVETASDGARGLECIKKDTYDVVILDYKMPGLSGVEVLKFIVGRSARPKVLITSGRPFIEKILQDENMSQFAAGVISKPFDVKTLLEEIDSP